MKRTPIRRISKAKAKADRELKAARARVLARDDQSCQFINRVVGQPRQALAIVEVVDCANGLEVHHILPRSRGGKHNDENLVTLCGRHHDWVHDNPRVSRTLGLLASYGERTFDDGTFP